MDILINDARLQAFHFWVSLALSTLLSVAHVLVFSFSRLILCKMVKRDRNWGIRAHWDLFSLHRDDNMNWISCNKYNSIQRQTQIHNFQHWHHSNTQLPIDTVAQMNTIANVYISRWTGDYKLSVIPYLSYSLWFKLCDVIMF